MIFNKLLNNGDDGSVNIMDRSGDKELLKIPVSFYEPVDSRAFYHVDITSCS
jgi:hypothetical protein